MIDVKNLRSVTEFVEASLGESRLFIDTVAGQEEEPAMMGYAEYGVPWNWAACPDLAGLKDVAAYRALAEDTNCSAWMDNTTIVHACALMSAKKPDVMTPLTVWDLASFIRAAVCNEYIYHLEHPDIDDARVNKMLGGEVLRTVPLPIRATEEDWSPPNPWDGAHRFMCETWYASYRWLRHLHDSVGRNTLDGKQMQVITEAWRAVLGSADLEPIELVDFGGVNRRWRSPSNHLLWEIADITHLDDTRMHLDSDEDFQRCFRENREFAVHKKRTSNILSDLNLRTYINQRIAEFFMLPYACSPGRIPFRGHLYARSLHVQQELTFSKVIDNRYEKLAQAAQLRLPIFLALALRDSVTPEGLWVTLAELRAEASAFRAHRKEMDLALARGNLEEANNISQALHTSVESLLKVAGNVTASEGAVILEDLSKGDISMVSTSIGAVVAAETGALESSFTERLMRRLRRPQLLWISDIVEQSHHLTEALPDLSRIWEIPPKRQPIFAERFRNMAQLAK